MLLVFTVQWAKLELYWSKSPHLAQYCIPPAEGGYR